MSADQREDLLEQLMQIKDAETAEAYVAPEDEDFA
jgi:hypothetical protein